MDDVTDLISQCQNGNKEAFGQLMEPFIQKAFRISFSIVCSKESAEDAVQNSLLEAYKNIMSGKSFQTFESWFYSLVASRSIDVVRKSSREKQHVDLHEMFELMDHASQPLDVVLEKEESAGLLENILNLPDKERMIIILYYYQELSIREISNLLKKSEGTVKMRIHRGRKRLKKSVNHFIPIEKAGEC